MKTMVQAAFVVSFSILAAGPLPAQEATPVAPAAAEEATTSVDTGGSKDVGAPTAAAAANTAVAPTQPPKSSILKNIILGYKSYNDSGRFGFQNNSESKADADQGRNYKGKHEVKLGAKTDSGWGLYGQITQYRYEYDNAEFTRWSASDPSVTLLHPAFMEESNFRMTGSLRYYVPFTDRTKNKGVKQVAYYLDSNFKFSGDRGDEIFNSFNPRLFGADKYAPSDSRAKIEDITSYTRKINSWSRWGLGQWTQFEQHSETKDGLTVDAFVQYDVMYNSKTFFGPRIFAPVFVNNTVYDAPRAATWDNAYFEIYVQANL